MILVICSGKLSLQVTDDYNSSIASLFEGIEAARSLSSLTLTLCMSPGTLSNVVSVLDAVQRNAVLRRFERHFVLQTGTEVGDVARQLEAITSCSSALEHFGFGTPRSAEMPRVVLLALQGLPRNRSLHDLSFALT